MTFAAFVLSTGRCGTQWLASGLANIYADYISSSHEPLHNGYQPRQALASSENQSPPPDVIQHLENIEQQLESRSYIECGHPCWSSLPLLVRRFEGRVRVIHLVRHPVPTSYSWLTHGAFQRPLLPHLPPKTLLSPFDAGVMFPEYQRTWDTLGPFEKCLYYWAEVNAFGLGLGSRVRVPWLRVRYEDLFSGEGLRPLLDFLELPERAEIHQQRTETVDEFHSLAPVWQDWRVTYNHPPAISIADQLGYRIDDVDEGALLRRYLNLDVSTIRPQS